MNNKVLNKSLFVFLFFFLLLLGWHGWVFRLGILLCLTFYKYGVVSFFFADEHWIQLLQLWKNRNRQDSEIRNSCEGIAMNGHSFKLLKMSKFFQLRNIRKEVAMHVEGFKMRKIYKIVVKFNQVVVRYINPLQIVTISHDSLQNSVQPW